MLASICLSQYLSKFVINVANFIDAFKEENCGFMPDRLTSKGSAKGKGNKDQDETKMSIDTEMYTQFKFIYSLHSLCAFSKLHEL